MSDAIEENQGSAPVLGFEFDSRYAEALFSVPHRVLGRRLRPFSLWHRTLLEYGDSPVLFGKAPNLAQLDYAVRVCVLEFSRLPGIPPRGMSGRLARALYFTRFNLRRETQRFYDYLDDYYSIPDIEAAPSKVEADRTPDLDEGLSAVAAYRMMTKCPREEPWNLPIGELFWMNAALNRREGMEFRIRTPQQSERLRQLKARRERERNKEEHDSDEDKNSS